LVTLPSYFLKESNTAFCRKNSTLHHWKDRKRDFQQKITPTTEKPRWALYLPYSLALQLSHNLRQFLRHRQTNPSCILHDGNSLVGAVKENDCRAHHTASVQHIDIQQIGYAHQAEYHHLLTDAFEAYGAGKPLFNNGSEHACDVIHHHEGDEDGHQTIHAAKKVPQDSP
jgi:hypothetical protein